MAAQILLLGHTKKQDKVVGKGNYSDELYQQFVLLGKFLNLLRHELDLPGELQLQDI